MSRSKADVPMREHRIQSGTAHYAESLPIEYQPDQAYRDLFETVLADSAHGWRAPSGPW